MLIESIFDHALPNTNNSRFGSAMPNHIYAFHVREMGMVEIY